MAAERPSGGRRTAPEHDIILLAASAALFAWLMQAALDFYFHAEGAVPSALLFDIPSRQLYSRVGITAAFLLTGLIISKAVRRLKRSEARARRLDQCVRSVRAINQLITRVSERGAMCQRACEELVSGLGYSRVRIELDGVTHGLAELQQGLSPRRLALLHRSRPDGDLDRDPVSIAMVCDGEEFGHMVVTPPSDLEWDEGERALLDEVAEDIAFSLKSIRTTERLYQQREEVQTILDSVSAYITYKDRGGRYIRVNKALADVAGIPQEEWVGRTLSELSPGQDEHGAYSDDEVMKTGKTRHTALEALELPDGTRWVQTDRVPYRDSTGTAIGVIALSVDVTDRMEAERALACRDEQLRQSQKMEAIGQLAGGIAHDFNNLLTAISGYTELARAELEPDAPASEMLFAVSKAADRAAALTRQLLAFSRKQPLWLAEQDLNKVVTGMTDMLDRLIGEDIELVTELDDTLGRIDADASQIEQVLMNLTVNARDAMPHGGRLTISTSAVPAGSQNWAEDSSVPGRDYVCLEVRDTGSGMDSETLAQIFEPFFTTKRPGVGTGLGLSVVDGIVEQHGGWVRAESEPGHGTCFHIYLPMAAHEPVEESAMPSDESVHDTPSSHGERILLVEDEETVRTFAARALTEWGYQVCEAASAEEAMVALEADPSGYDLIFSDIVLPGKSGTQLAEEVASRDPDARILLSSGYLYGEIGRAEQSATDVAFPLLKKPYTVHGLRTAVHEALTGMLHGC